jgi:Tol biopolymer transport system component
MIRRCFAVLVVVLGAATIDLVRAQTSDSAAVMLEAARQKETLDGDLRGAIKQYEAIVSTYGQTNRGAAAQALLRMAGAYEKLGVAEAPRIYERVVRDFGDQKDAVAIARSRLGAAATANTSGDRAVWTGPKVDPFGRVSPDGRYITYVDWNEYANLMVHDVVTNTDRKLTPYDTWDWNVRGQAGSSVISRDGRQVAYAWDDAKTKGIRVLPLHATDFPTPRQLLSLSEDEVRFYGPEDWSADGKWLAITLNRRDGTSQIALASVADGSLRVLKSMGWFSPQRIFFSPDSRYIAYDLNASDTDAQSDVFVMAIDASREEPVVVHSAEDVVAGWTAEGILFTSDRTGPTALWRQRIVEGKASGAPELLRDIGSSALSLGVTDAGVMFAFKNISSRDIKIAPVDLQAGTPTGPIVHFDKGLLEGPSNSSWSPDGRYLAYQACRGQCLAIRTVATGEVRRLPRTVLYPNSPSWSPDGKWLLVGGRDFRGRNGLFRIDAQTGAAETLVIDSLLRPDPQWSPDGGKLYYHASNKGHAQVERDLASGVEREIFRQAENFSAQLSPDGRQLLVQTRDQTDDKTVVIRFTLISVADGERRDLLTLKDGEQLLQFRIADWMPDSLALLVAKRSGPKVALWVVPIDGGAHRELNVDVSTWTLGIPWDGTGWHDSGFALSPDGRHIAFLMGSKSSEVWAIENIQSSPARVSQR